MGHLSAASSNDHLRMLGFLECPICLETFNDRSHTPRLLCCGHTLCQLCVERLVVSSSLVVKNSIRCPECRALCKWRGIQELPKNYILLHALENPSSNGITSLPSASSTSHWVRKIFLDLLPAPVLTLTGTNILKFCVPAVLERKLWELTKLLGASMVLMVLLPISIVHVCLSWWTALVGLMVFSCFSVGVVGIALFLLLIWWTQSIMFNLVRFVRSRISNQAALTPSSFLLSDTNA